jgi:hypothetical protein
MATKANLFIDQGATYETVLTLTDEDGEILDLTSSNATSQIRKSYSSSLTVQFTTAINVSAGEITMSLTANQTGNITAGRYVYDVELTDAANSITRIVEGIVTINPQVTR